MTSPRMTSPRNQYWRRIVPVKGEPIPDGAEYRSDLGFAKPLTNANSTFNDIDTHLEWRVPVPVVPLSVAVDAFMEHCEWDSTGYFVYVKGRKLISETPEQVRQLVTAKLIELAEQESTNGTH